MGPVHDLEKVSRAFDGSSNESGAVGDGQQLAKGVAIARKSLSSSKKAVTCD